MGCYSTRSMAYTALAPATTIEPAPCATCFLQVQQPSLHSNIRSLSKDNLWLETLATADPHIAALCPYHAPPCADLPHTARAFQHLVEISILRSYLFYLLDAF